MDHKENALLHGAVGPAMLRFALPFLAASFLQMLYGAVDMAVVGKLSTPAALVAVSSGSQVLQTITALLLGLATGGTVLIGQYVGAGRREDVSRTMGTLFPLLGLAGVGIAAALALCAPLIVTALQVPEPAVEEAVRYLLLCALGMLFVAGYNMVSGILRGLGDSQTPLAMIAVACVLNIVGDLILVGPCALGAAGAAIATVGAQGISFLLSLAALGRRRDYPLRLRQIALRRSYAGLLLKLGVPVAMQEFLSGFSFLLITAFVNRMGLEQAACVGVVEKVLGFAMLVPIAFMSAIAAMTAQNMGAAQPDRAAAALRWGVGCSVLFGAAAMLILQLGPEAVMFLFTDDGGVAAQGALYLRTYSIDCILVAFVFCLNGFFSGCGRTGFSMANTLIATFCVRAPAVLLISLQPWATMLHIGLAAPSASLLQIAVQALYLRSGRWRRGIFSAQTDRPAIS